MSKYIDTRYTAASLKILGIVCTNPLMKPLTLLHSFSASSLPFLLLLFLLFLSFYLFYLLDKMTANDK